MKNEFSISVNGIEKSLPLSTENSFGELLNLLRSQYSSESSCISAIRIDGEDLSQSQETAITLLPLAEIRKVEIFTAHPRELAEETLQNLLAFTDHLIGLSLRCADLFQKGESPSLELSKLFDGTQTFADALTGIKQVLHAGQINSVQVLEMDLLSIMKDLLESYHRGDRAYVIDLLEKHLPANMSDWRDHGLPTLVRSRDS